MVLFKIMYHVTRRTDKEVTDFVGNAVHAQEQLLIKEVPKNQVSIFIFIFCFRKKNKVKMPSTYVCWCDRNTYYNWSKVSFLTKYTKFSFTSNPLHKLFFFPEIPFIISPPKSVSNLNQNSWKYPLAWCPFKDILCLSSTAPSISEFLSNSLLNYINPVHVFLSLYSVIYI